jgi:hypothetical protein
VAAFWSGGSLAPPNVAEVPPGEHLTPGAVANAVLLAAVLSEPEKAAEKFRKFFALGVEVAEDKNRWPEEKPAQPAAGRAAGPRPTISRPSTSLTTCNYPFVYGSARR